MFNEVVLRKRNYQKANFHTNLNYSSAEKYLIFHYKLWKSISNTHSNLHSPMEKRLGRLPVLIVKTGGAGNQIYFTVFEI